VDNTTANSQVTWTPLGSFRRQFDGNISALAKRDPKLAEQLAGYTPSIEYFVAPQTDRILLAQRDPATGKIDLLPNPVPPARAKQIIAQVLPAGAYVHPILVAGLDQGWLWDFAYKQNAVCFGVPAMCLPLYLAAGQLERLWTCLHYQNWTSLLADPRVYLFVGPDAISGLQTLLESDPRLQLPKMALTVEPNLWANAQTLDTLVAQVAAKNSQNLKRLQDELNARDNQLDLPLLAEKIRDSSSLKILGITSRFTTFLQYSMRDWLESLQAMGHQTRLMIEDADHLLTPPVEYARQSLDFRPDLIVIIDHCRGEMAGLPPRTPCVMWVQDRLPHIYRPEAGKMQGPTDFTIGYGRLELTKKHGYPAARFAPAMVGVNENRFAPRAHDDADLSPYRCDASFVSNASKPADQMLAEEMGKIIDPLARRFLDNVFQRLRGIYDAGGAPTDRENLQPIFDAAMKELDLGGQISPALDEFVQRLNNALLRHQAIGWLADMDIDLRLFGRGWETHPRFKKFARGVADNNTQLPLIYQASSINLHASAFGSAHQRVFEGIACGGFFMLRGLAADAREVLLRQISQWRRIAGAVTADDMMRKADNTLRRMLAENTTLGGMEFASDPHRFMDEMEAAEVEGFTRSAGTLWEEYGRVAFWNRQDLTRKASEFLQNAAERRVIAQSMRRRVMEVHTYSAISRRMLTMISQDLAAASQSAQSAPEAGVRSIAA
jgi:hypothetical protein